MESDKQLREDQPASDTDQNTVPPSKKKKKKKSKKRLTVPDKRHAVHRVELYTADAGVSDDDPDPVEESVEGIEPEPAAKDGMHDGEWPLNMDTTGGKNDSAGAPVRKEIEPSLPPTIKAEKKRKERPLKGDKLSDNLSKNNKDSEKLPSEELTTKRLLDRRLKTERTRKSDEDGAAEETAQKKKEEEEKEKKKKKKKKKEKGTKKKKKTTESVAPPKQMSPEKIEEKEEKPPPFYRKPPVEMASIHGENSDLSRRKVEREALKTEGGHDVDREAQHKSVATKYENATEPQPAALPPPEQPVPRLVTTCTHDTLMPGQHFSMWGHIKRCEAGQLLRVLDPHLGHCEIVSIDQLIKDYSDKQGIPPSVRLKMDGSTTVAAHDPEHENDERLPLKMRLKKAWRNPTVIWFIVVPFVLLSLFLLIWAIYATSILPKAGEGAACAKKP